MHGGGLGDNDQPPKVENKPDVKIPEYKYGDPTVSRLQKDADKERQNEFPKKDKFEHRQPQIDLKVYQPENKQQQQTIPYASYLPSYAEGALPSVIKPTIYNLQIGGPSADYNKVNQIYEDLLPQDTLFQSRYSLTGRNELSISVFKNLFNNQNGNNIVLSSQSDINLSSYIKFRELTKNTNDLILYKSCYPIRQDPTNMTIKCAANSTSLNVRIYSGTIVNNERINAFYDWANQMLLEFKSPNFVHRYGYAHCANSGVTMLSGGKPEPDITLIITESPPYTLEGLFNNTAIHTGNITKMTTAALTNNNTKENILFQLFIIFEICKEKKLKISLNNIYVMDTSTDKYDKWWCYIINSNPFYLKNMGFLCVVDLNMNDKTDIMPPLPPAVATAINITSIYRNDILNSLFNSCLLTDNCIENIASNCKSVLNNKIGDVLSQAEKTNVSQSGIYNFSPGEIIVYVESYGTYKFGMYISSNANLHKILADLKSNLINVNTIFKYTSKVAYLTDREKILRDSDVIETYNIN
jgi:hypothetical protein